MTIILMVRITILLLSYRLLITPGHAVLSYEPQISYFDGASYSDNCKSKLERRVTALSGLLISHQLYGSIPYNASKNCFLLITAPSGYRIRLRVLDFNVLGNAHNCDKDTLHVFDHEKPIDPQTLRDATQEDTSPGPILGQFCGTIRNASELAVSTENALTLWWHTDAELPFHHNGEGFRLLWSAFRKSNVAPCNAQREFTCKNQECIAAELACNRYPDCKDESDLIRELQIAHKCDFLTDDPFGSLTGLTLLLISMAAVSLSACLCICACICCKCMKTPDKACASTTIELPIERTSFCTATNIAELQQPTSPGFYSPSPSIKPLIVGKKIPQKATMNSATCFPVKVEWTSDTIVDQKHEPLNVFADQLSGDLDYKHPIILGRDLVNQLHRRGSFTGEQEVTYRHLLVASSNENDSTPVQKNNDCMYVKNESDTC